MKRPLPLFLALVCTLALAAVLVLPDTAQAGCRGRCQVAPGGGFCLNCVTADHETGVLCQQSGPCTCYFILCAFALESSVDLTRIIGRLGENTASAPIALVRSTRMRSRSDHSLIRSRISSW